MKICSICNKLLELVNFSSRQSKCKICQKQYNIDIYNLNKPRYNKRKREYYYENQNYFKELNKQYSINNKEEIKEYQRIWYQENKESQNIYFKQYNKERRKKDPLFCVIARIRSRLNSALKVKKWNKTSKFNEYIGCSQEELKIHLENQFKPGMTWENRELWDIDHMIPLSSAKTEEELYKLSHYTNLEPLWTKDNQAKFNKILIIS